MSSLKNKQHPDGSRPLDPDPIWDLVADIEGTRTTQRVCIISWLDVICSRILTKTTFSGGDDGSALCIMPNATLVATSKNTTKTPFLLCTSSTPSSCESQHLLSHDVFIRLKFSISRCFSNSRVVDFKCQLLSKCLKRPFINKDIGVQSRQLGDDRTRSRICLCCKVSPSSLLDHFKPCTDHPFLLEAPSSFGPSGSLARSPSKAILPLMHNNPCIAPPEVWRRMCVLRILCQQRKRCLPWLLHCRWMSMQQNYWLDRRRVTWIHLALSICNGVWESQMHTISRFCPEGRIYCTGIHRKPKTELRLASNNHEIV